MKLVRSSYCRGRCSRCHPDYRARPGAIQTPQPERELRRTTWPPAPICASRPMAPWRRRWINSRCRALRYKSMADPAASIHVTAADRADYAVEACRFAVADDQATAQQAVAGTSVTRSAWRVETHGPAYADKTRNGRST